MWFFSVIMHYMRGTGRALQLSLLLLLSIKAGGTESGPRRAGVDYAYILRTPTPKAAFDTPAAQLQTESVFLTTDPVVWAVYSYIDLSCKTLLQEWVRPSGEVYLSNPLGSGGGT